MTAGRFGQVFIWRWAQAGSAALAVGLLAFTALAPVTPANAEEPIRIGELNSYNRFAAFTVPYRQGWQLAVEELNAAGGVRGRPLEIISRDDGGTTGDAVRIAEELTSRENVSFLFGTFLSNIGLAVSDFANRRRTLFIAAEPLTDALTMANFNRYTFRLRPNTYMQTAMLVEAAKASGAQRWAVVAPNYEYGQSAAKNFSILMPEAIEGAEIVVEQFPALGKIDAGATVAAIERTNPDAIFSVLFGSDLAKFVREGTTRGLFEDRTVVSLLTGEPEWLLPLGAEAPEGWIVTGYPWEQIEEPKHKAFVEAYIARWDDTPRLGSLLGYQIIKLIAAMIETSMDVHPDDPLATDSLVDVLEGLTVDALVGDMTVRALDHQTTLGTWVGTLTVVDGEGRMKDWYYADGADFMPSEAAVAAARGNN
ncbi:MAG: ABC transporter substrate-binding protein [Hyphomicrobiales bacterium]|nr:ABC transporter substrate-binding protein [Hyphomicrobiales bacterium]